jgi:ArsR family transcriptional regulator
MTDLCKEINNFGKSIGNETRYRILQALLKGDKTVNELVGMFHISQPAISQHLKNLKQSKLVTDQRKGQEIYYSVNAAHTLKLLAELVKNMEKGK